MRSLAILRVVLAAVLCAAGLFGWSLAARTRAAPPEPAFVQLTNDNAIDARPAWSPDDRRIAFQSNRGSPTFHIFVMDADGSHQRQLTQGTRDDRHPVWTPDGKSILFDSDDGNVEEIWRVNVADGSLKQITQLGAQANFVSPSPDGQRILFYLFRDDVSNLWTSRMDGSDAHPLTSELASAANNQCTFACHQAAWSADGKTIAYSGGGDDSIWVAHSDGSGAKEVAANGEHNHFPWFLQDGRLGYITEHISPVRSWTDAWVYDLATGQTTSLQTQMSPQGPFEWSRDNSQVLFHSPRSGNFEIYRIDLNAPGGVDALHGTPVPATIPPGASAPAPDAPLLPDDVPTKDLTLLAFAGVVSLLAAGVIGGLLFRRAYRARH